MYVRVRETAGEQASRQGPLETKSNGGELRDSKRPGQAPRSSAGQGLVLARSAGAGFFAIPASLSSSLASSPSSNQSVLVERASGLLQGVLRMTGAGARRGRKDETC